ncbi:MAG: tetratricopeptide repeat protein [Planctomycetota bacterium]
MRYLLVLLLAMPTWADALEELETARKKFEQLDFAGAEEALDRVIAAEPELGPAYEARGRLREERGATQLAAQDMLAASKRGADLWLRAGALFLEVNDYDGAAAAYLGSWNKNRRLDSLHNVAKAYASAGDWKRAIETYERVIKRADAVERSELYMRLGNLRSLAGDHAAGLKDLDFAIEQDTALVRGYQLRGRVKLRMGKQAEALADYNKAVSLAKRQANPHFVLGLAHFDLGQWKQAIQSFERSLALGESQGYTSLYLFLARGRTGEPALQIRAKKELMEFLDNRPKKDGEWFARLGGFLAGDVTEEQLIAEAKKANKHTARERLCEAWGYIGQRAMLKGDVEKARQAFRAAVATKVGTYMEFSTAAAELARLDRAAEGE